MTLLGIVFKSHYFAVVKVHLKNQKVSIWDSGIDQKYLDNEELSWFDYIVYLLHVHQPNKVTYDEDNMPNNIKMATKLMQTNWKMSGRYKLLQHDANPMTIFVVPFPSTGLHLNSNPTKRVRLWTWNYWG